MPSPVTRSDPSAISTTLKEAVVDSLVTMTHAQVSGAGEFGRVLFGARPRTLLNSGFLLPKPEVEGGDEVTSPIWISSHGLQVQVAADVSAVMTIQPKASVYVRILPREEDLRRPNCRPLFKLRQEVATELREAIKARLEIEWDKVKGAYTSRYKHPEWPRIREEIRAEIYKAKGVPKDLVQADGEEPREDREEPESQPALPAEAAAAVEIQDVHFEPLAVPHKWLRLDVPLPELTVDPSQGLAAVQQAAAAHADQMNRAM